MKKNNIVIKIKDLFIDYGESIAVDKINLEINKGELVTLLGPSGCGKSTTLNALAGLITPTSGDIYFKDKNVTRISPKERNIGLVFQSYALYPHMTVYKNISFPLESSSTFKEEINQHNSKIETKINKFLYEKAGGVNFDDLIEKINNYEENLKLLEHKLKESKEIAKNNIKSSKETISQTKTKRDAKLRNISKKTLAEVNSNEGKAIELKKELKNINYKFQGTEDEKNKLISEINLIIEKTIKKSNELYEQYDSKVKKIKSDYISEKSNTISNSKKDIQTIKMDLEKEIEKIKQEISSLILNNKDEIKKTKKEIKLKIKSYSPTKEDKEKIEKIRNNKLDINIELDKRVHEVANKVGISSQLNKKVTNLSGGQQQRVAISRTLVKNPDILLLDEPLSNLDAKMRIKTREWIRKLQQDLGITTIFVTHDQEEAMSISDKIVCMSEGHIQQIEEPMEMYHHPKNKFVAGFLGMPQMNFFDKNDSEILKSLRLKNKKDSNITFGIRPEHVKVKNELKKDEKSIFNLKGKVTLIESFGREKLLTMDVKGETIKLFTELLNVNVDNEIEISFKAGKLYAFDEVNNGEVVERI